jgi:hypothetical protein
VVTLPGSFTLPGEAGTNSFRFTGRLGTHELPPGGYTLVATPVVGGQSGGDASAGFRILR